MGAKSFLVVALEDFVEVVASELDFPRKNGVVRMANDGT